MLIAIAAVVALGVAAQWVSWRFHIPAILILLLTGFVAGPVTGLLDPSTLFGDLLTPLVSASVAIILFEGGLSLSLRELRTTGTVMWRLVSLGAIVTWAAGTFAAHYLVAMPLRLSLLMGAILTVTGPTVVGPLLRNVRPTGRVGPILRWEGILIDPIGAMLAVLVFEGVIIGEPGQAGTVIAAGILRIAAAGAAVGVGSALLMVVFLKRYLIPDFLHNAVSLALVLGAFTGADAWVGESGLVAVTVMGIVLANQRVAPVRHIIEFKETLRVLLISGLFIVLAAQIQIAELTRLGFGGVLFLGALILARPLAVWVSVLGSRLEYRERLFLMAVAPRGIVAAAIASVFALRLTELEIPDGDLLAPLAFIVIVGTIALYGTAAPILARRLGLSDEAPQGAMIVGAHGLARALASTLQDEGVRIILVDTDFANVTAARLAGLTVHFRSILAEEVNYQTDLGGIGRLLALTSNDELNALAVQHAVHLFGRAEVYQVAPREGETGRERALALHQRGRILFASDATYYELAARFEAGASIKRTGLSEEFTFADLKQRYGDTALPLFLVTAAGKIVVFCTDGRPTPKAGDHVISLVGGVAPADEDERRSDAEPAQA